MRNQIEFLKQEIMKLQNYQQKSLGSVEKIRDQGLESETYIRNLALQEHKLNEELHMIEEDNENAERIYEDLGAIQQMNRNKIREQIEHNEVLEVGIKKKEIERGRIEKKKADALSKLRSQEQRER